MEQEKYASLQKFSIQQAISSYNPCVVMGVYFLRAYVLSQSCLKSYNMSDCEPYGHGLERSLTSVFFVLSLKNNSTPFIPLALFSQPDYLQIGNNRTAIKGRIQNTTAEK